MEDLKTLEFKYYFGPEDDEPDNDEFDDVELDIDDDDYDNTSDVEAWWEDTWGGKPPFGPGSDD